MKNAVDLTAYRMAELCCGGGGGSCGFALEDYEVVLGCDFSQVALDTFRHNHLDAVTALGDLTSARTKACVIAQLKKLRCHVLLAGIPCQGQSQANTKRNMQHLELDSRAGMFRHVAEVVEAVRPPLVVHENVPDATVCKYAGRPLHEQIIRKMDEIGYKSDWRLLDAATFGVPQLRERLFIVSARLPVAIRFPDPTHSDNPGDGLTPLVTARDAIGDLEEDAEIEGLNHVVQPPTEDCMRMLIHTPPGRRFRRSKRCYRVDPDKPLFTVTTKNQIAFHYRFDRQLSVRELARGQSFPDSYILPPSANAARIIVGNAIPPRLAAALARSAREMLDEAHGRFPEEFAE